MPKFPFNVSKHSGGKTGLGFLAMLRRISRGR